MSVGRASISCIILPLAQQGKRIVKKVIDGNNDLAIESDV
jgi:hypothetical protein